MSKIYRVFKRLFKNRLRAIVLIIVLVVGGVFSFKKINGNNQQSQVQTQKAERGTIVSTISASGQVLTGNIINIVSGAKGLVKNVYVKDGEKVVSGQKIIEFTLDPDATQKSFSAYASYLSAKNSLDSAYSSLYTLDSAMWAANRTFINDAVSRGLPTWDPTYIQENDNWLAAESKYISQKNVISQSKVALNSAWMSYQQVSPILAAPMSDMITNITYSPGMTFDGSSSSKRIAVIKAEGTPLASFNISEIDVSSVKPGQKATIELDSIADKTFSGKVLNVDRIGSVTSNVTNYPVTIQFDTDSQQILPNMSASANIIVDVKDNVLLVPSNAIQVQGTQSVVTVLRGKQEETVFVETGLFSDSQTEIVSGLSEGDEVVIPSFTSGSQSSGKSVFGGGGFGGGSTRMFIGR